MLSHYRSCIPCHRELNRLKVGDKVSYVARSLYQYEAVIEHIEDYACSRLFTIVFVDGHGTKQRIKTRRIALEHKKLHPHTMTM